jgi:hypothetical protein
VITTATPVGRGRTAGPAFGVFAASLLPLAGCGASKSASTNGSSTQLTKAEQSVPAVADALIFTWCGETHKNPSNSNTTPGDVDESVMSLATGGLIALAQQKPNATYSDYASGELTMKQWLHKEGSDLLPCGKFGEQGVRMIKIANTLEQK